MKRQRRTGPRALGLLLLLVLGACGPAEPDAQLPSKVARSLHGMVSTGSAPATAAGVAILEQGGNAADAAAAAAFALMVTDPANTSLGGRVQLLAFTPETGVVAIDGATQVPQLPLPERDDPTQDRSGFATVPVPGSVAALERLVLDHGRLPLATVLEPARRLASEGFDVPARLGTSWGRVAEALARDPGAAAHYLKPDGSAYQAGERFSNPALARLLEAIADSGSAVFYRGHIAETLAREIEAAGGYASLQDFAAYQALDGVVVDAEYRGQQVLTAGGRGWGNTLAEMLNILAEFDASSGEVSSADLELLARVIAQAMEDRPQQVGSLAPKPDGFALETLSSPAFARQRATQIGDAIRQGTTPPVVGELQDHDTSHLSVVDSEGNAVALTTSIGPAFGARVASPTWGLLFGHSYRMRAEPEPGARDLTEMTPTIVLHEGRPVLVIGAAGSERIPTAILQVMRHVIDRGWPLEQAMAAPRLFALGPDLRVHDWLDQGIRSELSERGFNLTPVALGDSPHLGLVHAVAYDASSGLYVGVADAGDSGTAAGPAMR
jgi:gamma-glutamyltranspeptidase/glutathione hydrolase